MMQPDLLDWQPLSPQSILGDRAGETFNHKRDVRRLNAQAQRVWDAMSDGRWWSLSELAAKTSDPEASISARLRDFRKPCFGGHTVEQVYIRRGLHRYRLVLE